MKYLILILLLTGCCNKFSTYKVGDCFMSLNDVDESKIIKVGEYGVLASVWDNSKLKYKGNIYWRFHTVQEYTFPIDCPDEMLK